MPHKHRYASVGWGRRAYLRWADANGNAYRGLSQSSGAAGVRAIAEDGSSHRIEHGQYTVHDAHSPKGEKRFPVSAIKNWRAWVPKALQKGQRLKNRPGLVLKTTKTGVKRWQKVHENDVKPGASWETPNAYGGGSIHVHKQDENHTWLTRKRSFTHGGEHTSRPYKVPTQSVPHHIHDMRKELHHDPEGAPHPVIKKLLSGGGKYLGKGQDGVVYRVGGHVVKVSTTTPFQAESDGHRTPAEAIDHLRNEYLARKALQDLPMVQKASGGVYDGRFWMIRPYLDEAKDLTPDELDHVRDAVLHMHDHGWTINDQIQVGRDANGHLQMMDLGQAVEGGDEATDVEELSSFYYRHDHALFPENVQELQKQERPRRKILESALESRDPGRIERASRRWRLWADHLSSVMWFLASEEETEKYQATYDKLSGLLPQPMRKASLPLKPGQRWITVHPNGKDERGVPVIIEPAGEGVHRIVGGAGGKLSYLKLKDIKSEEEYKKEAKGRRKKKAVEEKKRKSKMSAAAIEDEKQAKQKVKDAKRGAERDFIEKVRAKAGNVSEDLDESNLIHMPKGAKNLVLSRHHAKQLREAKAQAREIAEKVAEAKGQQAGWKANVAQAMKETPAVAAKAQELATLALQLDNREREERKIDRRKRKQRRSAGKSEVGSKAAEAALEIIDSQPSPDKKLERLGGRDDKGGIPSTPPKASDEVTRRSLQALQDARLLKAASEGDAAALKHPAVREEMKRRGLEETADDGKEELQRAAAAKLRRFEVEKSRAKRFAEIEKEESPHTAMKALAHGDMVGSFARAAGTAKRLGLLEAEKAPPQPVELAEMREVLSDAVELAQKSKEFRKLNKEIEKGDYLAARSAFKIDVSEALDTKTTESIREQTQRSLTNQLLGLHDTGSSVALNSVAQAHYSEIADVSLGIGGQRYLDRSTVEAIGLKNAAILTRFALESDGHDGSTVLHALEGYHADRLEPVAADAIATANKIVPDLSTAVETAGDIETALLQLDAYNQDIDDAQSAVGAAIGKMEATATMGHAFRTRLPDQLEVKGDTATTLQWLHSVGLRPEHYQVDHKQKKVSIPSGSWDNLITKTPKAEMEKRARAVAIRNGEHDEEGWLPTGIARRANSSFNDPVPESPPLYQDLDLGSDVRQGLEDHIGSRLAEGEHPSAVMTDLLSPQNIERAPDRQQYIDHVRELFPMRGEDGKKVKYEEVSEHFEGLSDRFMEKTYGKTAGAIHSQDLQVNDPNTHEAVFRSLAEHPTAVAAFKPLAEMTHDDKAALRDFYYDRMGIDKKTKVDETRYMAEMQKLGPEPNPDRGTLSMSFMAPGPSPEWKDWARDRDEVLKKYRRASLQDAISALGDNPDPARVREIKDEVAKQPTAWGKFVNAHTSLELAQTAMQHEIRGDFAKTMQRHHGQLTGRSLRVGVQEIPNKERHIKGTSTPDELDQYLSEQRSMYAKVQKRERGGFADMGGKGAAKRKASEHLVHEEIDRQNQMAMFSAKPPPQKEARKLPDPGKGERHTLGKQAEEQLTSMVSKVGKGFKAGQKVPLFGIRMDKERVHGQRVIKMLQESGSVGAFLGTGTGKTAIGIGGFTHLHSAGDTKHGLFLVPAAVQSQFDSAMLQFTEPGQYNWSTGVGKKHADRVAMLKDDSLHMRVMTHQAFRDTALQLMSEHHGRTPKQMRTDMESATPETRARWMREAFDAHGIPKHMVYEDEAHLGTWRDNPSGVAMMNSAVSHPINRTHYLAGTATPHKNDEREVFAMASKLDPVKYQDAHEFMQAYGQDLAHNPDAIRREMAHMTYTAHVKPEGVKRLDSSNPRIVEGRKVPGEGPIKLTGKHAALVDKTKKMYERARAARQRGGVDVEAMKFLAAPGKFDIPAADHERVARDLSRSLGIIRESAMRRAVNLAPVEHNQKLKQMADVLEHDVNHGLYVDRDGNSQKGKPSIVFSDSLAGAKLIHEELRRRGLRSALYHGGLTASARDSVRLGFDPKGSGPPKHDVIVSTASGEAGLNLQRGKAIHHYDVPQTMKSHAQRSGRAYRQGQTGNVDVHDWHTDTEFDTSARRRLRRKSGLADVFQSPLANLDEHGVAFAYQKALQEKHKGAA